LFIRLNSFVEAVNSVPNDWYEVKTTNTVTGEQRSFYTPKVVIAAGSTESPKLINRSSVYQTLPEDIKALVGFGLTDHPVSSESQAYVTSIGNPRIDISPYDHAKIVFYSKGKLDGNGHVKYPFNIEMNVNHEYWHLRNNDPSNALVANDPDRTRVDIKFSFANCLDDQNGIYSHANDGYTPFISFKRFSWLDDLLNSRFPAIAGWQKSAGEFLSLLNDTRDTIFNEFNDVEFQTIRRTRERSETIRVGNRAPRLRHSSNAVEGEPQRGVQHSVGCGREPEGPRYVRPIRLRHVRASCQHCRESCASVGWSSTAALETSRLNAEHPDSEDGSRKSLYTFYSHCPLLIWGVSQSRGIR
jgi:hypothetical protein